MIKVLYQNSEDKRNEILEFTSEAKLHNHIFNETIEYTADDEFEPVVLKEHDGKYPVYYEESWGGHHLWIVIQQE